MPLYAQGTSADGFCMGDSVWAILYGRFCMGDSVWAILYDPKYHSFRTRTSKTR